MLFSSSGLSACIALKPLLEPLSQFRHFNNLRQFRTS